MGRYTTQSTCIMVDGKLYINDECVEIPGSSRNVKVTQINEKVYVNGYERTDRGWKRTLAAIFHYLF